MITTLEIADFIEKAKRLPVIDVRTPNEFEQGHIPNALNMPLFSNEERAAVGTKYKQANKEAAVLLGLEYVGPKLAAFVKQAQKIAYRNELMVHCWRGGMRSGSMAWLLNLAGLKVSTLIGGYKSYRSYIRESFRRPAKIIILSGFTGSGKSEILQRLSHYGEQILDLEQIANHKGSVFGALGLPAQPTNEQFENNIYSFWQNFDFSKRVWIEDESDKIGYVSIPVPLFEQMKTAKIAQICIDKDVRIQRLINEYAHFEPELLRNALEKISKRLGGLDTKLSYQALYDSKFYQVVDLALKYYDKAYNHGIEIRRNQIITTLSYNIVNSDQIALQLIEKVSNNGF